MNIYYDCYFHDFGPPVLFSKSSTWLQIFPVSEETKALIPTSSQKANNELVFTASVPAVGYMSYYVETASNNGIVRQKQSAYSERLYLHSYFLLNLISFTCFHCTCLYILQLVQLLILISLMIYPYHD